MYHRAMAESTVSIDTPARRGNATLGAAIAWGAAGALAFVGAAELALALALLALRIVTRPNR
jgi:hypothetical protein